MQPPPGPGWVAGQEAPLHPTPSDSFCRRVSTAAILACVGPCTASAYAQGFFAISSTVSSMSSRFITAKAEAYSNGLSRISFRHITDVHDTKSGFLVFVI
ncbi:hypothetical protein DUI87_02340 [Hirundo rustica rustica]|uniref:Uncharacterized protein n=1 Tax=Hirundo rustica rustica TaxID=333673 RepID=A0A3M0LC06_HIRRU|nr:hypothetical protein DUI87_02340 [Hirundo rustica rustica]